MRRVANSDCYLKQIHVPDPPLHKEKNVQNYFIFRICVRLRFRSRNTGMKKLNLYHTVYGYIPFVIS